MKLHKDSHVDHGLTAKQLAHVLLTFESREAFFKETITLPDDLGTVPCALFGPIMGDKAIPSFLVEMKPRGERKYPSRVITRFDPVGTDWIKLGTKIVNARRTVNTLTVIGGPHDDHERGQLACILYTAFGGPITPREPGDPTLSDPTEIEESIAFWSEHALVVL